MLVPRCTPGATRRPLRRMHALQGFALTLLAAGCAAAPSSSTSDAPMPTSAAQVASESANPKMIYDFRAPLGNGLNRVEPRDGGGYMATTRRGGEHDLGTVVRIDEDGSAHVVYAFDGTMGGVPLGGLTRVGNLYVGTTSQGGEFGYGTAFSITVDGEIEFLHSFKHEEGGPPRAGLVHASDGNFYGTTGGLYDTVEPGRFVVESGARVFRMTPDGWVTVLHTFGSLLDPNVLGFIDAGEPVADLIDGGDGYLYGTTAVPASWLYTPPGYPSPGTIFRISLEGNFESLYTFSGRVAHPVASLVKGPDGLFYGTTAEKSYIRGEPASGTVYRISSTGEYQILAHLPRQSEQTRGRNPASALVVSADGQSLLGITDAGGAADLGVIFRVGLDGTVTTVASVPASAGRPPWRLARDPSGTLLAIGQSTIAVVSEPDGAMERKVLVGYAQGASPTAITQASDGFLYGVTDRGGANDYGTVFRLDNKGALTVLHSLEEPRHGALVEGPDGALYGTTGTLGDSAYYATSFPGRVYRVAPDGSVTTLHQFRGADGHAPSGPLTVGTDGTLYGTTRGGGTYNQGTAFRLTPDGTFTLLHSFGGIDDGPEQPNGGMLFGSDGDLYGTSTMAGPINPYGGTVFRMKPTGEVTTLVLFDRVTASGPRAGLARGADGLFYGTTDERQALFRIGETTGLEIVRPLPRGGHEHELLAMADGRLYGALSSWGSTPSFVYGFDPDDPTFSPNVQLGSDVPGRSYVSGLTLGRDGALYGTYVGSSNVPGGWGSIFRYTPAP